MNQLICTRCKQTKSIVEFARNRANKSGYSFWCKLCKAKQYVATRELVQQKCREYQRKKPEQIRERRKEYYKKNRETIIQRVADYRKANPEKVNRAKGNWAKRKYKANPMFKFKRRFSDLVRHSLRGGKSGESWRKLVGYSFDDLRQHMERQFSAGMSWENYGKWHIDHIIPISVFNYKRQTDTDFLRCWSLKNLQPLWASDNCRKSNKLLQPFQPSLPL